ncbi:MAG TPA: hypothetical protein VFY68_14125 [Nitrososphaeraceae archaeon]|nr:hypothetical protein [Nitrososphaeraceae archaeon]
MKIHIKTVTAATAMFLVAAVISFNSMTAYAQGGANMTGTTPDNQTMQVVPIITSKQAVAIDANQIRDEIRSNHPLLAAIADQIQTMDARETLKYTLGVEIVSDMLKMHAMDLIMNRTAGSQSAIQ